MVSTQRIHLRDAEEHRGVTPRECYKAREGSYVALSAQMLVRSARESAHRRALTGASPGVSGHFIVDCNACFTNLSNRDRLTGEPAVYK